MILETYTTGGNLNFSAIIYQIGKQESLDLTVESVIKQFSLDGIAIYLKDNNVTQIDGRRNQSITPVNKIHPNNMRFGDVIVYLKSGTTLNDGFTEQIEKTLDAVSEPRIGAIYSDYILINRNRTSEIHLRSYERMNWMATVMETPMLAVRNGPGVSLTLSPDINYFAHLNQSTPIVRIPEHLVTLNG